MRALFLLLLFTVLNSKSLFCKYPVTSDGLKPELSHTYYPDVYTSKLRGIVWKKRFEQPV